MSKSYLVAIISFLLLVIGFIGCINDESSTLDYINEEYGFAFNPPEGWAANESGSNLSVVIFMSPSEEHLAILLIGIPAMLETVDTLSSVVDEKINNVRIHAHIRQLFAILVSELCGR